MRSASVGFFWNLEFGKSDPPQNYRLKWVIPKDPFSGANCYFQGGCFLHGPNLGGWVSYTKKNIGASTSVLHNPRHQISAVNFESAINLELKITQDPGWSAGNFWENVKPTCQMEIVPIQFGGKFLSLSKVICLDAKPHPGCNGEYTSLFVFFHFRLRDPYM